MTSCHVWALLLIASAFYLYTQNKNHNSEPETFADALDEQAETMSNTKVDEQGPSFNIAPYSGDSDSLQLSRYEDSNIKLGSCDGKSQFLSTNLLPKNDPNIDSAAEFAPSLDGKNFVDSYKYMIGSQSQSLRNANYQLRSDPQNPQEMVCPWNQSTISPEERRKLDIGAGK